MVDLGAIGVRLQLVKLWLNVGQLCSFVELLLVVLHAELLTVHL